MSCWRLARRCSGCGVKMCRDAGGVGWMDGPLWASGAGRGRTLFNVVTGSIKGRGRLQGSPPGIHIHPRPYMPLRIFRQIERRLIMDDSQARPWRSVEELVEIGF